METHGKPMENPQENHGKTHRKPMENPWKNPMQTFKQPFNPSLVLALSVLREVILVTGPCEHFMFF